MRTTSMGRCSTTCTIYFQRDCRASFYNTSDGSSLGLQAHRWRGAPKDDICIAVEIKPKCGFLPTSEFIARRNVVKKYVTRFRVHQLLKLHLGEANFIDLGIKPLDKMIHYYELDNRIVSFYSKNVGCCENGAISN
ncbi:hypothetical protein HPP92_006096 [Vanilla planifolia]|uniref:Inositol-pentakisphosphate 2-kinase n=1 Tax=Vanilla planifolia TaxID=51239 RepID=A0A835RZZ8_VANPL|nr:hypothetical protein HPP92_006096 [Vanilla planifolia]